MGDTLYTDVYVGSTSQYMHSGSILFVGLGCQTIRPFLLNVSFPSETFSEVCVGRRPLPLCNHLPTAKKFGSGTHKAMLLVK